ncbi:MAG TPA: divalent metal cation transporter [Candidatus Paceibacterota bacterium]|nr:divalent metal cation transporter [Candidatus Paceibacterota bacterium]
MKLKKLWKSLGPGLITGAADDDPSAIATYSIAGAVAGTGQLWILLYILPFMIAVQSMCARIGALTGCGLAANIKQHYPKWLLLIAAISLVAANVFNIGADVYGMAGALNLFVPIKIGLLAVIMAAFILWLVITLKYRQIERIFKWFALSLYVYGIALLIVKPDWPMMLLHTLVPSLQFSKGALIALFAVLGTTISPYIFFWQASEEAEVSDEGHRVRTCKYHQIRPGVLKGVDRDTNIGMISSNVISFFIMALTASTIFRAGGGSIVTLRDAAQALVPLAGPFASILFAIGLVGSGLLAIPVLAGSAAYVVAELMGWPASLDRPFNRARQFYIVIVFSVVLGMLMPLFGITPIQALFWTAIINGLIAPILIMLIIDMARNPKIVGPHTSNVPTYMLGLGTLLFMLTGTIFLIFS